MIKSMHFYVTHTCMDTSFEVAEALLAVFSLATLAPVCFFKLLSVL